MPVYDLSYRHWGGKLLPRSQRWMPIATAGLAPLFKKRSFLFWMFLSWSPALIAGVMVYILVKFQVKDMPFDAGGSAFNSFFQILLYMHLLTSAFVGAGLIANDRKSNALQIYLSKPMRRWDYLLGKGATVAAVMGIVTLGPTLSVYLLRVGLDKQGGYFLENLRLPFAIFASAALISITMSILALTVSSFTKSGRTAGVALVMLYVFSDALHGILSLLFGQRWTSLLFPLANLKQGLDWFFGAVPHFGIHPILNLTALALILAGCVHVLRRRIRAVEVIR
jgi:ABC-2 type transport system permease protein